VVVSTGAEMPDAGRREPTMTLAGWRRFVDSAPASFDLLAGGQWQVLSGEQRGRYDEARISYHSELVASTSNSPGCSPGVRGKQIAGRCVLISTGPFPLQQEWAALLATLEGALRLHRHKPGTLPRLGKYLHQRTGGMIGSLSHLVRAAALVAILDGTEQITRKLLDGIPVDHAAQSRAPGAA